MPSYYQPTDYHFSAPIYYLPLIRAPLSVRSSLRASPPAWTVRSSLRSAPPPDTIPMAPRHSTVPLPDVSQDGSHQTAHRETRCSTQHPSRAHTPRYVIPPASIHTSVDPLIALPQHPTAKPPLTWDLMYPPSTARIEYLATRVDLRRRSVFRIHGRNPLAPPIQSIVLMFPLLPMEFEIKPSNVWTSSGPYITIGDVLEGLYRGLRLPVVESEVMRLSDAERETLRRASERRCRLLPKDSGWREVYLYVDYLGRRRRFLGIRPALPYEIPGGRESGEVYIVEVGTSDG
ncbi:hypothetical protein C8Q74DRAFT_1298411 [Fomes fomentarius]|nr:hypothetical protein C8Q74DRAFT_1298411 [Fomes fomentarius]